MSEHKNQKLKECVFRRIEDEKVAPRSRMYFHSCECFVWTFWLVSVIVGALAVAISVFVVTHRQYALYEATHDNFLTFMVEVLPYLWIVVFGAMAVFAVYNLRHTKRGYRYPVSYILASSIVLSFAIGSALQFFGLGYAIDNFLGKNVGMYMSQEKVEYRLWQNPSEGRLIGQFAAKTISPTTTAVFEDVEGNRWRLNLEELMVEDITTLEAGGKVRVLGKTLYPEGRVFHACGVFPWALGPQVTVADMSHERQEFIRKAYDQMDRVEARLEVFETEAYATTSPEDMAVCADIALMKRMNREKPAEI